MSCIPQVADEEVGMLGATKYSTTQDVDNIYFKVCSNLGIEYISMYKLFTEYIEIKI